MQILQYLAGILNRNRTQSHPGALHIVINSVILLMALQSQCFVCDVRPFIFYFSSYQRVHCFFRTLWSTSLILSAGQIVELHFTKTTIKQYSSNKLGQIQYISICLIHDSMFMGDFFCWWFNWCHVWKMVRQRIIKVSVQHCIVISLTALHNAINIFVSKLCI